MRRTRPTPSASSPRRPGRARSVDGARLRDALEAGPYEGIAGAYAFSTISHSGLEPDALVVFTALHGTWTRTS